MGEDGFVSVAFCLDNSYLESRIRGLLVLHSHDKGGVLQYGISSKIYKSNSPKSLCPRMRKRAWPCPRYQTVPISTPTSQMSAFLRRMSRYSCPSQATHSQRFSHRAILLHNKLRERYRQPEVILTFPETQLDPVNGPQMNRTDGFTRIYLVFI